jgi:hypothetical protein
MHGWKTGALVAVGIVASACAAVNAVNGSKSLDGDLSIDATVHPGMRPGGVGTSKIHVGPEGDAEVMFEYVWWNHADRMQSFNTARRVALDPAWRVELRRSLERSAFFGWWASGRNVTDMDTWHVTVRCGDRTKSRKVYDQSEFDGTAWLLWRTIQQAVVDHALAVDRTDALVDLFDGPVGANAVLDVGPLVARLRETAVHGDNPESSARAMALLDRLLPADEFDPLLRAALVRDDAAFRQATLATFVDRGAIALPLRHRDVVLPAALAEMERSGRDWGRPPAERAQLLRDCASALVVEHEVRAAPVFERMVVDLSTDERPLVLAPLPGLGDAAIDPLSRLLDHERVGVRIAAARMCEGLACELTSPSACARPQGCAPSRTLAPFRERLVPKLERAADDASADPRLRRAASEALAAIGDRSAPPGWEWHRLDWN